MALTDTAAQLFLHKALMKQPTEFKLGHTENDLHYILWEPQIIVNIKDNGVDFEACADQDIEVDVDNAARLGNKPKHLCRKLGGRLTIS